MNPLDQLSGYSFPMGMQNARMKPIVYYDTLTMATGTLDYYLFNNPAISLPLRNKQFPISGNEIFFLTSIKALLQSSFAVLTAANTEFFTRAYFELVVNDKQVIKVPLCEIMTFQFAVSTSTYVFQQERKKILRFPIIINSGANIKARICFTANGILNTQTIKVELGGIKLDKLSQEQIDFAKNMSYERLNATIYDTTQSATPTSARTYDLFADPSKSQNDINKTFPLSNYEVFQVENIELFFPILNTGDATNYTTLINALRNGAFRLLVEDNEVMNFASSELVTALIYMASTVAHYQGSSNPKGSFGLTLPEPIEIGTNSRVKIQFDCPALAANTAAFYFTAMLKGTLQRRNQ